MIWRLLQGGGGGRKINCKAWRQFSAHVLITMLWICQIGVTTSCLVYQTRQNRSVLQKLGHFSNGTNIGRLIDISLGDDAGYANFLGFRGLVTLLPNFCQLSVPEVGVWGVYSESP